MPQNSVRRITWRTADVARVFAIGLLFLLVWRFFWMVYSAIFIALIAVLLAIVLHAPARFFARWIPYRLSFAVVVLGFVSALVGLLIAIVPQVVEQMTQLTTQLPSAINKVGDWMAERTEIARDPEVINGVNQQLMDFVGRFVPLAFNIISAAIGSFAILILAIFMAYNPEAYRDLLINITPPGNREKIARVYDETGRSLRAWVLGKSVSMLVIGLAVWIGLILFKIPGALALAALAALLEFIPNLGPTIAAAPAVIAAFLISPATALWVAIFYLLLQQLQSGIAVPLVERRAVDIPPAALLVWQIMLAIGFGILGLFVATPLLAIIVVVVRVMYVEPSEDRQAWDRREQNTPEPAPDLPVEETDGGGSAPMVSEGALPTPRNTGGGRLFSAWRRERRQEGA